MNKAAISPESELTPDENELFEEITDLYQRLLEECDAHEVKIVLYSIGMVLAYATRQFQDGDVASMLDIMSTVINGELGTTDSYINQTTVVH